jgi:hypothetical protein
MYYHNYGERPSFGFIGIVILILIVLLFIQSCQSNNIWNNGICSCGGTYKFQQAVGHYHSTYYMYICDKCGHSIEITNYYPEVKNEATK